MLYHCKDMDELANSYSIEFYVHLASVCGDLLFVE